MKYLSVLLRILALFITPIAAAQGTITFLSNLDQTYGGSFTVASDQWYAESFTTGNAPGGYSLNSVQLLMNPASGNPNGFTVAIYPYSRTVLGNSLGTLAGAAPASGGGFAYTTPGIALAPNTFYFIVFSAAAPLAEGGYNLNYTTSPTFNASDVWSLGAPFPVSPGVVNSPINGKQIQFAINATMVPEPGTFGLLGMGASLFFFARHKQRRGNLAA